MYYATYKCKLCGEIIVGNTKRNACESEVVAKETVWYKSFGCSDSICALKVSEKIPHHCKNGDWGICEFIGMSQRS